MGLTVKRHVNAAKAVPITYSLYLANVENDYTLDFASHTGKVPRQTFQTRFGLMIFVFRKALQIVLFWTFMKGLAISDHEYNITFGFRLFII